MLNKNIKILVLSTLFLLLLSNFAFAEDLVNPNTDKTDSQITDNYTQFDNQKIEPLTPELEKQAKEKEELAKKVLKERENSKYPDWASVSTASMIAQPDYNTCGPTTAHNVLTGWGLNISISTLATELHYDGQTPLGPYWPQTLNNHVGYSYYVLSSTPTQALLWMAYGYDIGSRSVPFVLDTYMSPSTGYLVGFSGWAGHTYIYHYVTAYGYTGYDTYKNAYYFDSYDYRTGCYGEHYMQLGSISPMVSAMGIVW